MKYTTYKILRYINRYDEVDFGTLMSKFFNNDLTRCSLEMDILFERKFVSIIEDNDDFIYQITILGKDEVSSYKSSTIKFLLPLVLSIIALVISLIR